MKSLLGQKKDLVVIADGPLQSNHKICLIRRPSSQVDILGETKQGEFQPGRYADMQICRYGGQLSTWLSSGGEARAESLLFDRPPGWPASQKAQREGTGQSIPGEGGH